MAQHNLPSHIAREFGKKNYTKAELREKEETEVVISGDNIVPSPFLPSELHPKFEAIVEEFEDFNIMADIDADAISRYIMADYNYWMVNEQMLEMEYTHPQFNKLSNIQNRYLAQANKLSDMLGLTMVSRMKLRKTPSTDETDKPSEEEILFGEGFKVVK